MDPGFSVGGGTLTLWTILLKMSKQPTRLHKIEKILVYEIRGGRYLSDFPMRSSYQYYFPKLKPVTDLHSKSLEVQ